MKVGTALPLMWATCVALVARAHGEGEGQQAFTGAGLSAQEMPPGSVLKTNLRGSSSKVGNNLPQQIHIALAGKTASGVSNGMSVSWLTDNSTKTSVVKYGTQSGHYPYQAMGNCSSYLETWNHHVVLQNLQPNTRYYYTVGDADEGFSREYSFVTAPDGMGQLPLTLMVYGDMGIYNSDNTRYAIDRRYNDYSFIWHLGDISYADDAFLHHLTEFYYEKTWNEYMRWMENVTANKPYMVLPGNHEAECHSLPCILNSTYGESLRNFTAYNSRFRMPAKESGAAGENMWYSFNYGPIHFVNIDTETDFEGAPHDEVLHLFKNGGFGKQLEWLERDLREANASRHIRPWILVGGHRPVYSILNADKNGSLSGPPVALSRAVEDLFYTYGVDIYFCGHQHSYERQWPVYKTSPEKTYNNPKATTYIVNGAAGNTEWHTPYWFAQHPEWNVMKNSANFGYGLLTVYNSTTLHWGFYASKNDSLLDEFTLYKRH